MRSSSDRRPAATLKRSNRLQRFAAKHCGWRFRLSRFPIYSRAPWFRSPPSGSRGCSVALSAVACGPDAPPLSGFRARDCAFPASTLPRSKAPSSIASRSVRTRGHAQNSTTARVPYVNLSSSCPRTTTRAPHISLYFSVWRRYARVPKSNFLPKAIENRSSLP